ncbi:unnamed protein product [Closterium sp. NIES-53]
MNRLVTRVEEFDKRGRKDVTNTVQELRVERANATSQRKTAALTLARIEAAVVELKSMIFSAINTTTERTRTEVWQNLVGFENYVANAAERGASAGAMMLRTVMGSFTCNFGPTSGPEQLAGRIPTPGAGPAADTSLPLILSGGGDSVRQEKCTVPQGAEGEAGNHAKRAKTAGKYSSIAGASVKDGGVAITRLAFAEGKNEGAVEISDDEDAEAMDVKITRNE